MAHSVETRVPFLDNDLVDFAQKIPVKYKLKDINTLIEMDENEIGKIHKTNDGKIILRKSMRKHVPDNIREATKQGFSSPDQSWFKGESIEFIKQRLLNDSAKIYDYIDKKTAQNLINQHLAGEKNRRLMIWSFLNIDEYLKIYN